MNRLQRSMFLWVTLVVFAEIFVGASSVWAQSSSATKKLPSKKISALNSSAASAKSGKTNATRKKKMQYISGEGSGSKSSNFNSDSTEGWIVKRTKDGKIIKIPRKQTFKFGGSEVSAEANRPNETLLGSRITPKAATLIPERRSYRKEILSTVGFQERNNNR